VQRELAPLPIAPIKRAGRQRPWLRKLGCVGGIEDARKISSQVETAEINEQGYCIAQSRAEVALAVDDEGFALVGLPLKKPVVFIEVGAEAHRLQPKYNNREVVGEYQHQHTEHK